MGGLMDSRKIKTLLTSTSVLALVTAATVPTIAVAAGQTYSGTHASINNTSPTEYIYIHNGLITANPGFTNSSTIGPNNTYASLYINTVTFDGAVSNNGVIHQGKQASDQYDAIYIVSSYLDQGLTNTGQVLVNELALSASTALDGIDIQGGAVLADLLNTNTISVIASATNPGAALNLSAVGITVNAATFHGSVRNSGTVWVYADAHTANSAVAIAHGIDVSGPVSGSIANTGGTIVAMARAEYGTVMARADAAGIYVTGSVGSGITNNSTISAAALAEYAPTLDARAVGIGVTGGLGGGVVQTGTLDVFAGAFHGSLGAHASAAGIYLGGLSASGGVYNGGDINVTAKAEHGHTVIASAGGIVIQSTAFSGGVTNDGAITVEARSSHAGYAAAEAVGIYVGSGQAVGGIVNEDDIDVVGSVHHAGSGYVSAGGITVGGSFSGGISNGFDDDIDVSGYAGHVGDLQMYVSGIYVDGDFYNGITNAGYIGATARAWHVGYASEVAAAGIVVTPITDPTFQGGVNNSGEINAYATLEHAGGGNVYATGAYIAGNYTFGGGVSNSGHIYASASAAHGGFLFARAGGVDIRNSVYSGGVTNTGSIYAQAYANRAHSAIAHATGIYFAPTIADNAGIINQGGTIYAHAAAYYAGTAFAHATGVDIGGEAVGGGLQNLPPGNSLAVPEIIAWAQAYNTAGLSSGTVTAEATGVYVNTANFYGGTTGIYNNAGGQILAYATASNASNIYALARGVFVNGSSTFTGGLTNGGTIAAFATVTASYGAEVPLAQATGVAFTVGVSAGGNSIVNNQGALIWGYAQSNFALSADDYYESVIQSTALARGVSLSVATSDGGISNSGTIAAEAENFLTVSYSDGSYLNALYVHSTATGILVNGGILGSDNIDNLNTGIISAVAGIHGTVFAVDTGFLSATFSAGAHGINATGQNLTTSSSQALISNAGTISAMAVTDLVINSEYGYENGFYVTAIAQGIHIGSPTAYGGITNSGVVTAMALAIPTISADHSDGETFYVGAFANGIVLDGQTFGGGISNSGLIEAVAIASPSVWLSHATISPSLGVSASAHGIYLNKLTSYSGGIYNSGTIAALASAGISTGALTSGATPTMTFFADAEGIDIGYGPDSGLTRGTVTNFSGGVTNSGLISATAYAGAGAGDGQYLPGGAATAYAVGIDVYYVSSFIGNVVNTKGGIITANAHAYGVTALATAGGIEVYATSFSSSVVNAGTIQALAEASYYPVGLGGSHVNAEAFGILVSASSASGGITNSGVISATAIASENVTGGPGFSSIAIYPAIAEGIGFYGSNYSGGITNSGLLVAAAMNTGTLGVNIGTGNQLHQSIFAAGIQVGATQLVTANTVNHHLVTEHDQVTNFSGGVTNTGTISAVAMNTVTASISNGLANTISATAYADGIYMDVGDFDYVSNSGLIEATAVNKVNALFAGGNSHVIVASAYASGIGIDANTYGSGSITNTGTISALATNSISATYSNSHNDTAVGFAQAFGIVVTGDTIVSPISNSGTITAMAVNTVSATFNANGTNYLRGTATAVGVGVQAFDITNTVVNTGSGLISAGALSTVGTIASIGGSVGETTLYAAAVGVGLGGLEVSAGPLQNAVPNSSPGPILADYINSAVFNGTNAQIIASAQALAKGYNASANASAVGVGMAAYSLYGSVTNAGLISAAATANGVTANAFAAGIAFDAEYLGANVTNTGFVYSMATAYASGEAEAAAYGVLFGGDNGEGPDVLLNGGTIAAFATATGSGSYGYAEAYGVEANSDDGYTVLFATNTGSITAGAVNVLNATFGTSNHAHGYATAIGIDVHGFESIASIFNSGTISAYAESTINAAFTGTSQHSDGFAKATGIAIHGAIADVAPFDFFGKAKPAITSVADTSGIFNTGTISATAVANVGTITGYVPGDHVYVDADANGINVGARSAAVLVENTAINVSGSLSGGLISALALAHGNGFDAKAQAAGVNLHAGTLFGVVLNSGSIQGIAIAGLSTSNSMAATAARAHATAAGVSIHGGTVFGGVANYGTLSSILGEAQAYGTISAHAYATGVSITGRTVYGVVENEGTIRGQAVASAGSWAGAHARGVSLTGRTLYGGVQNSGQIFATASAIANHAWAHATGVHIGGASVYAGVTNSGLISALANASVGSATYPGSNGTDYYLASASATGVDMGGRIIQAVGVTSASAAVHAQAAPNISFTSSYVVTNSGLISAVANAGGNITVDPYIDPDLTFTAKAVGVNLHAGTIYGSVINTGSYSNTQGIFAVATSSPTATLNGEAYLYSTAEAAGLRIHVGTMYGGVTNTGSILAQAFAVPTVTNGATYTYNHISATARARAVDIHAGTIYGGVVNSGTIAAAAFAAPVVNVTGGGGTVFASAEAYGMRAHTYYWGGGVTNYGSIGALAVASATPTYGTGTTVGSWGVTAYAKARGIDMVDYSTGSSINGGLFNGTSGVIWARAIAIAQANGSGTQQQIANAIGVKITTGTFNGDIVNNGAIIAYAQAGTAVSHYQSLGTLQQSHGALNVRKNFVSGSGTSAVAQGVSVNTLSFNGDITNNGYIGAEAVAWNGYAQATGVLLNVKTAWGSDGGMVTNYGTILARAKAGSSLTAAGIRVATGSISPGTITNYGVIGGIGQNDGTYPFVFTTVAIDISGAAAGTGTTINYEPGYDNEARIIGDTWLSASNPDTVNIYGGHVNGSIIGGGVSYGWYNNPIYYDPHTPNYTYFASNGQTINLLPTSTSTPLYLGFSPYSDGAVTPVNGYSPFYYSWGFGPYDFGGYTFANVQTVQFGNGQFVLAPNFSIAAVGTLNIGSGVVNQSLVGNQEAVVANIGHITTYGPTTGTTWVEYVTAPTNTVNGVGTNGLAPTVNASTINIGSGVNYVAFETPGFYAPTNLYGENFTYQTLNGSFGIVSSYSPLFTAYLGPLPATDGDATLTLTRVAFGAVAGLDGKEQAFGNYLESQYLALGPSASCTGGSFSQICEIEALTILNASQYQKFMSLVDGEVNMQVWQPLVDVWENFETGITNRLGSQGFGNFAGNLPNLSGGIGKNGVSLASMMNSMSDAGSPLGSGAQTPANGGSDGYGFWGRGYGIFANGSDTSVMTGFSENIGGVMAGFDMAATDNLVLGAAFDYAHGNLQLNNGVGQGSNDQYQIALYGRYDAAPWYVNGVAGVGWGNYDQSRTVNGVIPFIAGNGQPLILPVNGVASASYGEQSFAFYGETGYTFKEDGYVLQPLVGLGYIHANFDSFTETGAGIGDLTVGSANANSLISTLGGRAQTTFELDGGGKIIPSVLLAWQHEYLDTALSLSESLASSPYAGFFGEKGPDYGRDNALLGVGIEGDIWAQTKLFLDYDVKLNGDYTAHAVSAGLRVDF
jgi:uncharacterized protein YhjY with autotransporter beta-barrel domain